MRNTHPIVISGFQLRPIFWATKFGYSLDIMFDSDCISPFCGPLSFKWTFKWRPFSGPVILHPLSTHMRLIDTRRNYWTGTVDCTKIYTTMKEWMIPEDLFEERAQWEWDSCAEQLVPIKWLSGTSGQSSTRFRNYIQLVLTTTPIRHSRCLTLGGRPIHMGLLLTSDSDACVFHKHQVSQSENKLNHSTRVRSRFFETHGKQNRRGAIRGGGRHTRRMRLRCGKLELGRWSNSSFYGSTLLRTP